MTIDCIFCIREADDLITCINNVDLSHEGAVPASFCLNKCLYRQAHGFEKTFPPTATEPNLIKTDQTLQTDSNCTGCPEVVRRNDNKYVTVVPAREGVKSISKSTSTIRREPYTSRTTTVNPIEEPSDKDWAVVVTTAPRSNPTIEQSVQSIKTAGWNPVVFAEPDSVHLPNVRYVANEVRLGAWFNWLQSVKWALKNTIAQYIMTVQDDSLFHPDSRSFVESVMWPSHRMGFLSLYTASHYSADLSGNPKPYGLNKLNTTALWGACALVFPRPVLQTMLEHPVLQNWKGIAPKDMDQAARANWERRREEAPQAINNVDSAIGKILNSLHLDMYVIDPSPVTHIATHSAISHGGNTGKRNCGRCADHSIPLSQQVFPNAKEFKVKKGLGDEIQAVLEKEIGYKITCETCLAFLKSIDKNKYSDLQDLVLQVFANGTFPDEWRKKHVGRTGRLERIETLIKPLVVV